MSQTQRLGKTSTKVYQDEGKTCIRYHQTDVVRFNDKIIELDTGGWSTATTKLRMNQASNQFGLGFQVYQKDFNWFVKFTRPTTSEVGTVSFTKEFDRIAIIDRTGNPNIAPIQTMLEPQEATQ